MAGLNLSLFLLFLLAFDPCQTGLPCANLCKTKRTSCANLGVGLIMPIGGTLLPCATCNTTGQTDENQLGCLPGNLKKLQVAGHSDRSGKLKTLPRLGELRALILGPGDIRTVGRGAFEPVPNILGLYMKKNVIKAVGNWFGGITKLKNLALSWNEIEEIKENAFQPLRRLEYLELMHNRLRAVQEWHFSSLTYLRILHLSYNNISHIAGKSFNRLSRLDTLSLDHNKLSFLSTEWLQGLSTEGGLLRLSDNLISTISAESLAALRVVRKRIYIQENPFRCTCALSSFLTSRHDRVHDWDRLQCSYPPGLSGRKIADAPRGELPCPSPAAKVSRQDHGATLVCEVFWEKRPEIKWLDPRGRAVGDRQSLDPCGGTVTTRLEHDYPTTRSTEGGKAHPRDDTGLPYIGRSTSTLHMNPQAYQCWTGGSFRCVVKSATSGSVFEDLPLTKSSGPDQRHEHTETTAAVYTSTPAQQNARMTERIVKTTDKTPRQDGTTPSAGSKPQRRTKSTAVYTSKPTRQNGRITESMSKATDKNGQQDGSAPSDDNPQWNTVLMIGIYIGIVLLAVFLVDRVVDRCRKCYRKRQQRRQYFHGNAAGAIGGIPLQNLQPPAAAPTTGNPQPPQHTYDVIPDDTPIAPYAETTRLENPMYGADVKGPRGADPRSNIPANSKASSQPGGSATTHQAGTAPDPPPRSDRQGNDVSDSTYYPPGTDTTQAEEIPAPLPRTNWYVNSNVSSQPGGSQMPQAERIPDPLPRTHTYINSNVSARPQSLGMATTSRNRGRASNDLRGSGMDEEGTDEGPNLYLDLNGPPRHSGSEMRQAEIVPDPLPRTNSNVSAQPEGSEVPQAEDVPDPLPRTNIYINSNVSAKPEGSEMPPPGASSHPRGSDQEDVEGLNIYLDLNGPSRITDP